MASLTRIYADARMDNLLAMPHVRTGGSRRHFEPAIPERDERRGSHMPLDTSIHWEWRNPINILPALILVCLAIAVLAMVLA